MEGSSLSKNEKRSFFDWLKNISPKQTREIIASLIVLSNQKHSNIFKIKNIKEIESLISWVSSKQGRKNRYIMALNEYKDYLRYLHNENNEEENNKGKADDADKKQFAENVTAFLNDDENVDQVVPSQDKSIHRREKSNMEDTSDLDAMISPQEITEDFYRETYENTNDIGEKSSILQNHSHADYNNIKKSYTSMRNRKSTTVSFNTEEGRQEINEHYQRSGLPFNEWLRQVQGMADGTVRSYDSAINTADTYAREHNIGHGTLRGAMDYTIVSETAEALFQSTEFIELNKRQHNRFHAALQKYLEYIRSGSVIIEKQLKSFAKVDFTPYREILLKKFPRGFRIDSRLDMGRLRIFWKELYGSELLEDDETIRKRIAHITIRCQDFVYLPEMMASEETKKEIFAYIDECFKNGKTAVYFDALYKEFLLEFSSKRINNPGMLKSYIAFVNGDKYYIHKNYLTTENNAEVNPTDEVRDYMISVGVPIKMNDLKEALSHIDENMVFQIVAGRDSAEFVRNKKGEYFHADIIHFTQQEIDTIIEMIQHSIDDKGYMGGKELTNTIEVKIPAIIERYPFLSWLGLRDVIAYKLQDVFSFKGKIISAYGQDLSMSDIFAYFAEHHKHFTLEQLNSLKKDLDTPIYFDDVYENSLRINKDDFVSRDRASFDIEATDEAISRFCTGDYIPLQMISFFGSFPDANFPWNGFLLEHYVAKFSKKFKLLHIGFNASRPVGAIVKRNSCYNDFDEVIVMELATSQIPLDRENALQYLVDSGLLARKKYKGIEQALLRAKIQRSRKG